MDMLKKSLSEEMENLRFEYNSLNEKYKELEKEQSCEQQSQSQLLQEYQEMLKTKETALEERIKIIESLESKVRKDLCKIVLSDLFAFVLDCFII
jgi:predicted nuclease with TOPRIM domain